MADRCGFVAIEKVSFCNRNVPEKAYLYNPK